MYKKDADKIISFIKSFNLYDENINPEIDVWVHLVQGALDDEESVTLSKS